MSLQDKLNQAEKEHNLNRDNWFKFQEGNNKIRVLSEPAVIAEHFKLGICYGMNKGCPHHNDDKGPSVKWLTWIIDRKDDEVKLAKLPHSIFKSITALQNNEDYHFESFPMPFDITITAKNAGTKEVEYVVLPGKETPVVKELLEKLEKEMSPEEIVTAMKRKQARKDGNEEKLDEDYGVKKVETVQVEESNPNDIPF